MRHTTVVRACAVGVALAICAVASASPQLRAIASSGDRNGVQAHYYACLQGDPVSAPAGLAPGAAAPPDLLAKILAEPLHKNGHMCAWFTGGTAAQQRSAAFAFGARQSQDDGGQQPLTCAVSGDIYLPVQETSNGDVIKVVVHYRRNAPGPGQTTCSHTFYNNQYSFVTNPNNLWLDSAEICDSTSRYCTNLAGSCSNIPVTVNFNPVGLGDPDLKWWQTVDQYAASNFLGCQDVSTTNATFSVLT